jgi:uncharacterized membrane protein YkvA (DUF1232 family)
MDSNDIRSQINAAFEHEDRTKTVAKLLAEHLARAGASLTPAQQTDCLNFVKAYIREAPDIMDAAFHAAQQAGVLDATRPIFDAAFNYWAEQHDFIPDKLGLIGVADDAYLTRMFMEAVSGLHAAKAGRPLLSVDLGPANRVMRGLIGEPIVTQLDALVGQTIAGQMIQSGLQQLAGFGSLDLSMPGYGNYISQYDIDHEVNVRLGAMGVV